MANGEKRSLEVWLDFAKALIWPFFIAILLLKFAKPIEAQVESMIDALKHSGGQLALGPGGVTISVLAQQEKEIIQAKISSDAKPASPSDPVPSAQAISEVKTLNTLQTLAQNGHASSRFGWIYCGQLSQGRWTKPPNLKVAGQVLQNQTYRLSTDTYLRESPPQGVEPKGQVIGIVPEGQQVTVLEIAQVTDKEQPDSGASLVWVKIENKEFYGMSRN